MGSPLERSNISAVLLPMYLHMDKAGQSNLAHFAPLSGHAVAEGASQHGVVTNKAGGLYHDQKSFYIQ